MDKQHIENKDKSLDGNADGHGNEENKDQPVKPSPGQTPHVDDKLIGDDLDIEEAATPSKPEDDKPPADPNSY